MQIEIQDSQNSSFDRVNREQYFKRLSAKNCFELGTRAYAVVAVSISGSVALQSYVNS